MKVLQVLYSGLGGHGSVVTSLINADVNKQWEHALLFYGIEDLLPAYEEFCRKKEIPYSFVGKKKGLLKSGSRKVKQALRKHKPDIILLHSPNIILTMWWYCLFRKTKFFVIEHTSNSIKGFPELLASLFSLLLARKVIYLSPFYQKQLRKKFWFFPVKNNSVVIQNGIDLQQYKPNQKFENATELHAGMIGRFIPPKNQSFIVEALEKGIRSGSFHQKIIIHFAGNGDALASLKDTVQKRGLHELVLFHGLLDEKEIINFFWELDFYVHASYAETMCTAVMQALACGLPVLASNISGINDIVQEKGNALLFNNDDINTLISGMVIMQDPIRRKEMGECGRQYALIHFSAQNTFREYNKIISA